MRALIINCTVGDTLERGCAQEISRMLEKAFRRVGVTTDVAYPSDLGRDLAHPSDPRYQALPSPLSDDMARTIREARILAVVVSTTSGGSIDLSSRTLRRVGAVLDRGRAPGARVAAPVSLAGGPDIDRHLLSVCCQLLDAGYLVPEQCWVTWSRHGLTRRAFNAANDLVAVAAALGIAGAREAIAAYPPFLPSSVTEARISNEA